MATIPARLAVSALLVSVLAAACTEPPAADPRGRADSAVVTGGRISREAEKRILAEVRAAFFASREALRRLDVEAFLQGYDQGSALVVIDPSGEYVGREAYETYVRAWFAEARRTRERYPLVTARERVYPLDERTAAVLVDWAAPGGPGPYRSLLLYRKSARGWRISAEHSAPTQAEPPVTPVPDAPGAPERHGGADSAPDR